MARILWPSICAARGPSRGGSGEWGWNPGAVTDTRMGDPCCVRARRRLRAPGSQRRPGGRSGLKRECGGLRLRQPARGRTRGHLPVPAGTRGHSHGDLDKWGGVQASRAPPDIHSSWLQEIAQVRGGGVGSHRGPDKAEAAKRSENRKRNTLKERVFLPGKTQNLGQGPDPQIIIVTRGLGRRGGMPAGLGHTLMGLMIFTFIFF